MSGPGSQRQAAGSGRAAALARVALGLYPAAWRDRYGEEVRALLDDSGADLRTVTSLVWQAALAWVWPPRHLYDRPARMRASLVTVFVAWTMLAGLGLVFAQLTEFQGARPLAHPEVAWSYRIFDVAVAVSLLAGAVGGTPLWLLLMRTALRRHRRRTVAVLLSPAIVPVLYLGAVRVVVTLLHQPGGVGQWWFLAFVLAGFVAASAFAAGPALALRALRPQGPAVELAARAAFLGALAMGLAGAASIRGAVGATLWAPQYGGYHQGWPLAIYCPLVLLAAATAVVSAGRGFLASQRVA
jgi:hypothetical protein